ncbi:MAG TPA: translation elongation factor P, partial [Terriglobia bacterium]|nr:translation elongation factor P [Terriglobia bacterium]
MVIASQFRPGTVLKIGDDLLKVVEAMHHVGQGKMPGSVHAKLQDVVKGTFKELRFRPEEKLEDTVLEKREMEYLYSDTDSATFMDPNTFDQIAIPLEAIGAARAYLKEEMMVPVEY